MPCCTPTLTVTVTARFEVVYAMYQTKLCWMVPPARGTAWSHCVGRGDVDGPTCASNKSEAGSLVSVSVILVFASLCFIFKCP